MKSSRTLLTYIQNTWLPLKEKVGKFLSGYKRKSIMSFTETITHVKDVITDILFPKPANPIEIIIYYLLYAGSVHDPKLHESLIEEVLNLPDGYWMPPIHTKVRKKHLLYNNKVGKWIKYIEPRIRDGILEYGRNKLQGRYLGFKKRQVNIQLKDDFISYEISSPVELIGYYILRSLLGEELLRVKKNNVVKIYNNTHPALRYTIEHYWNQIIKRQRKAYSYTQRPSNEDLSHYFKILGLNTHASFTMVKKHYRMLTSKYHPDRHSHLPKDELDIVSSKMKEINNAYSKLEKHFNKS